MNEGHDTVDLGIASPDQQSFELAMREGMAESLKSLGKLLERPKEMSDKDREISFHKQGFIEGIRAAAELICEDCKIRLRILLVENQETECDIERLTRS